jgi:hypothetical protein
VYVFELANLISMIKTWVDWLHVIELARIESASKFGLDLQFLCDILILFGLCFF